ncbi:sec-independent translocase [Streptacidiphilus monticola]|jgi:sec-independent protein translocase protein TatB|uniref:Sec-independent protein translocase protein TatB n=1 Tax=Streptacidiphilus monticola TaxID=2161674 RepID=A0ABW1G2Q1_9ACTN
MFFDIGPLEMVALVVLAVLIFGPDKLPKLVADVMGFIRKVREFSDSAKEDIRKELGPEYQDFEFQDLHPKNFVRKQLSKHGDDYGLSEFKELKDGLTADAASASAAVKGVRSDPLAKVAPEEQAPLRADEHAPYDLDAT